MLNTILKNETIAQYGTSIKQFSTYVFNQLLFHIDATAVLANLGSVNILIRTGERLIYSGDMLALLEWSNIRGGVPSSANSVFFGIDVGAWAVGGEEIHIEISNQWSTSVVLDCYIVHNRLYNKPQYKFRKFSDSTFTVKNCDRILAFATALDEHAGDLDIMHNGQSQVVPLSGSMAYTNVNYKVEAQITDACLVYDGIPRDMSINVNDAGGNAVTLLARQVVSRSGNERSMIKSYHNAVYNSLRGGEKLALRGI